jgi:hypothetical protein
MNETTLEAEAPAPSQIATLTASDRCDLCGAQAYVNVVFETGELLFCGHHATKFKEKIDTTAITTIDERWQLGTAKLDVSA